MGVSFGESLTGMEFGTKLAKEIEDMSADERSTHGCREESKEKQPDVSRVEEQLIDRIDTFLESKRAEFSKMLKEKLNERDERRMTRAGINKQSQINVYRPQYDSARPHRAGSMITTKFEARSGGRRIHHTERVIARESFDKCSETIRVYGGSSARALGVSERVITTMKRRIRDWADITGAVPKDGGFNIPVVFSSVVASPGMFLGKYTDNTRSLREWVSLDIRDMLSTRDRLDAAEWMPVQYSKTELFGTMILYVNIVDPQKNDEVIIRTIVRDWAFGPTAEMLTVRDAHGGISSLPTAKFVEEAEKYRAAHILTTLSK